MAKEVKVVFIQADKGEFQALSKMLSAIRQTEYFFILVPSTVNVLSKEEVLTMLSAVPD